MPIPVALFIQRFGYKRGVILGLCLYGTGALLLWPAAERVAYGAFLGAVFVIACGIPSEAPGLDIAWDLDAIERMSIASGKIVARAWSGGLTAHEHTMAQLARRPPGKWVKAT